MHSTLPLRSFPNVAFEMVPLFIWLTMALSHPFKKCLSPPGDQWCDVLGFVHAGSVSSFPTLQIVQEASHLWGLLCPLVYVPGCFPSLQHVQGSTHTGVFKDRCRPSTYSSLGFPFHLSLFVVDDGMCGLTVTSWSNPAEVMGDCFHLQCLWRSSCTREYCTVFDELDLVHCVLASTL